MRLAVISHACVIDVNQRLFGELCRRSELDVLVIAPERWLASTGRMVRFQPLEGARFQSRPLPVIGSGRISLHLYRGLGATLADFQPDAVYLDEEPYSLAAWQTVRICRRYGWPLCFMTAQNLVKRFPWPFSAIERATLANAAMALPPAPEIEGVLRSKGFEGEVRWIPHFVDTDLFRPMDCAALREELGVRGTVVGYLGRLAEEKGITDLQGALEMLWKRGLEASLLLVGGGPLAERLRAWARGRPVRLTGPVPHSAAPRYMNAFDLLVLPSRTMPNWKEQFGRVLIEASACEVPVVGSDSGHIPALIDELDCGVVFEERRPEALADAIERLIADARLRTEIGRRARQNVKRTYGLQAVADRLQAALSEL